MTLSSDTCGGPDTLQRIGGPRIGRSYFRHLVFEELESRSMLSASPVPASGELAAGQSVNDFGLDLYYALQSQAGGSGNLFLSPLSISVALAMAYAGAGGATASQMASVLHFGSDPSTTEQDFGALLSDLNAAGQGGNYSLNVADALWAQQGLQLLAPFLNTMQSDFAGGLQPVDFANDPQGAINTINNWVSQETNGKIPKLVSPADVSALTQLVLTNAVYFKGAFATPFPTSATADASFTLPSGSSEQVPMMHNAAEYEYMQSDGYQVVELPYADGRLALDVLLPTSGTGAGSLSVSQLPPDLTGWLAGLSPQDVDVSLPKFTMTTQFQLGTTLADMGMPDAFSNDADFSGMTDPSQLQISNVIHKAYISVNEAGTEAAAATGVVATPSVIVANATPPIEFDADHSFLFMIRDTQTGSVLFMGQEADPLSQGGDPAAAPIAAPGGPPVPQPIVVLDPSQPPVGTTPPVVAPPSTAPPTSIQVPTLQNPGPTPVAAVQSASDPAELLLGESAAADNGGVASSISTALAQTTSNQLAALNTLPAARVSAVTIVSTVDSQTALSQSSPAVTNVEIASGDQTSTSDGESTSSDVTRLLTPLADQVNAG